jgi:hypothetical protein
MADSGDRRNVETAVREQVLVMVQETAQECQRWCKRVNSASSESPYLGSMSSSLGYISNQYQKKKNSSLPLTQPVKPDNDTRAFKGLPSARVYLSFPSHVVAHPSQCLCLIMRLTYWCKVEHSVIFKTVMSTFMLGNIPAILDKVLLLFTRT